MWSDLLKPGESVARPDRDRGFTLIELLIAAVMLGIGMLGLAKILLGTGDRQALAESHMELTTAGADKLEEFRNIAVTGTSDTVQLKIGGSLTSDVADHSDSIQTPEGRWYVRRWEVTAGPAGTREVTLRVTPQAGGGKRQVDSRDFTTLILVEGGP